MQQQLKRAVFKLFLLFDKLGIHILPKHYYAPIPDYAWLNKNKALWTGRQPLSGVYWDLDQQLEWLEQILKPYYNEVEALGFYNGAAAQGWGPGYGPIESQVLHCFIRATAPARVVEIGSGVSTACILHAVHLNGQDGKPLSEITCIEPYPNRVFSQISSLGKIRHIQQMLQAVPRSVFDQLQSGDMLFIDSSHAVKTGSDVMQIYFDILPQLPPGVFIHIHDIYLPYIYPRQALSTFFDWQETALLLALLTNNQHLSVLCCLSALHYDRADKLCSLLSDYQPQANSEGLCAIYPPTTGDFPASTWLRTC